MMTPNLYRSSVQKKHRSNHARTLLVETPHGSFVTPTFMPVGTRAFVNHMTPEDLSRAGVSIVLGGNTYHMLVYPGLEVIEAAGGMHQLMGWPKPMLTDSGGFQVFSLSKQQKICRITDHGAEFKHPHSGQVIHLTPASSMLAQRVIGADIIMAFDQCTPEAGGREAAVSAMAKTHRWLLECKAEHQKNPASVNGKRQALFGIIQGGSYRDLREESAKFVVAADLEGIAIGGESIGFDMEKTVEIIDWVRPFLPEHKVRYTMGVGLGPQDLIDVVAKGVDIFDCVAPTRNARHGALYHGFIVQKDGWLSFVSEFESNRLLIKKSQYAKDTRPILEGCQCTTCGLYSRAYLHLLFKQNASLYAQAACVHNVHVMQQVCLKMQEILLGK